MRVQTHPLSRTVLTSSKCDLSFKVRILSQAQKLREQFSAEFSQDQRKRSVFSLGISVALTRVDGSFSWRPIDAECATKRV